MNIAENKILFNHEQYEKVRNVILEIKDQNLLTHGAGFCWGMCDLVYQRLNEQGIKSRIIECELTLVGTAPASFVTVGGAGTPHLPDQVSTHVVVVTEHPTQPLLIDCSIAHILPDPFLWVCAFTKSKSEMLSQVVRDNWTLTYRPKVGSKYPALHQNNIVERIKLDEELKQGIRRNKLLTVALMALGAMLVSMILYNRSVIVDIQRNDEQVQKKVEMLENRANRQEQGIEKILKELNRIEEKKKNVRN